MRTVLLLAALAATVAPSNAQSSDSSSSTVTLEKKDATVVVEIDGEEFAVYNFADRLPKPFFSPVRGAGGAVLTRVIGDPDVRDHPHHKGVWVSVDEVNKVKFWAEDGKIDTRRVKLVRPEGNPAAFRVINAWKDENGQTVVTEETLISIYGNRLLAYDITLSAGDEVVAFEDTKEGFFGIRLANTMRESEGGKVKNADGRQGTKACWGRTSAWVDYSGEVDGKTYGVALFDHPLNIRPARYHVRNYGLFSMSPFGESAYTSRQRPADPIFLLPHGSMRWRYGLYVHSGDTEAGRVAETYVEYLEDTAERSELAGN